MDTAPQEKEDGAHPAAVQREAKRHEALLVVRSDGKPDRRHHPAEPNYQYEHSTDDQAFALGALGFIAKVDARHGHEENSHSGNTQD